MTAPVVVFAVGNPSRGDDAIGPILCGQLEKWLENSGLANDVELIEDFQLNIEHALDLVDRQLALFIDAGSGTPAPYSFTAVQPQAAAAHSTHALEPAAILDVYQRTEEGALPPAWILCVRGESFDLGAELSPAAERHLAAALAKLQEVLGHWQGLATASLSR